MITMGRLGIAPPGMQWRCLECGRTFKTMAAAERAAWSGCTKCGGVDVDYVHAFDPECPCDDCSAAVLGGRP